MGLGNATGEDNRGGFVVSDFRCAVDGSRKKISDRMNNITLPIFCVHL